MKKLFTKISLLFIGLMLCAGNAWATGTYHDPNGNSGNGYYEEEINGVTYRVDYTYSQVQEPLMEGVPIYTTTTTRSFTSTVNGRPVARITGFNSSLPYVFIGPSYFDIIHQSVLMPGQSTPNSSTTQVAVCIPKGTFLNYSGMIFLPTWNSSSDDNNVYYSGEGDAVPVYSETFGPNAHVMVYTLSDLQGYSANSWTFTAQNTPENVWSGHLTVFPSGEAPDVEHEGDFGANNALHWTYYSDKTLAVTANDPNTPAAMPDLTWNGSPAWKAANGITINDIAAVHIGSGVTRIGNFSFYDMSYGHVVSVTFADNSVTAIGNSAFYGAGFSSIDLPSNLATIGESAFSQCDNLTTVTLPASVTAIGEYAFQGSDALQTVVVNATTPPTVNKSSNIFENISTIVIPDETVCDYADDWGYDLGGTYVFKYSVDGDAVECDEEPEIDYTCGTNLTWSFENGVLTISGTGTTMSNFTSDARPWETYAASITEVVIEALNMTNIGSYAFRNCTNLTTVTVPLNSSLATLGSYALSGSPIANVIRTSTRIVRVPTSYSGTYEIPEGTVEIAENAFSECTGLTAVTIPNTVTTIGSNAFSWNSNANFTTVVIPNSVTSMGTDVFNRCTKLTSVTLPSGLTTIPASTFYGCTSLTSVEIPAGVTEIGGSSFRNCTALTAIHMKGKAPSTVGTNAFKDMTLTFYVPKGTAGAYDYLLVNTSGGIDDYTIVEENTYGDATSVNEDYSYYEGWDEEQKNYAEAAYEALVASASAKEFAEDFTIVRPIQANGYLNTICLPFDLSEAQIANSDLAEAEIFAFDAQNTGAEIEMVLNEVTEMEAGMPYFFRYPNGAADAPNLGELNFHGVTVKTATSVAKTVEAGTFRLKGTLQNTLLNSATNYLFLGAEDALFYPDFGGAGVTDDDLTLRPFRAYFERTSGNNAPARITFGRKTTTSVENIDTDKTKATKILENGQVLIIRNGVRYNVAGQVVK